MKKLNELTKEELIKHLDHLVNAIGSLQQITNRNMSNLVKRTEFKQDLALQKCARILECFVHSISGILIPILEVIDFNYEKSQKEMLQELKTKRQMYEEKVEQDYNKNIN